MNLLMGIQSYLFMIAAALSLWVTLLNRRHLNSLVDASGQSKSVDNGPLVSILIPARNEESNIGSCLAALAKQDYRPLEILVLDDRSTDRTAEIIGEFAQVDERIHLMNGDDLPGGWVGKNWACHQLAKNTSGEFLLFIDADTVLSSNAVSDALASSQVHETDLLTVMPKRTAVCLMERLIFPFIDWAVYCWMPMKLAHRSKRPLLSATFGQFIFFKRTAYDEIGGHEVIRDNPLDDFELGRLAKQNGLKWRLFHGMNHVNVLAGGGNIATFKAVSRSVFPALYYRTSLFAIVFAFVFGIGFFPPFTLIVNFMNYPQSGGSLIMATASTGMVATTWIISYRTFKHRGFIVLIYPLSIALMCLVSIHSLALHGLGRTIWRGRRIEKRRFRL